MTHYSPFLYFALAIGQYHYRRAGCGRGDGTHSFQTQYSSLLYSSEFAASIALFILITAVKSKTYYCNTIIDSSSAALFPEIPLCAGKAETDCPSRA